MKILKSLAFVIAGGALTFGLSACGDDVTEQVTEQIYSTVESVGSVDSKKDLPECTKDLAGQTAFVKNPGEFFGCDGESWRQLGNNSVSFGDNFCYSEELKDEEGFEIFCNKVSLGKVFNGEDGKDGKDGSAGSNGAPGSAGSKGEPGDKGKPGDGCKMIDKQADSLKVVIQCGTETFPMNLSGMVTLSECEEGDTDCADPQGDVQLSGQSQKGPYVSGTDVSAYELLDGKSLKQTGNMFAGKIEREDGLFNIKTVKLSSQYAYLVADGFYRNEVTGKVSNTTLKLRALANLKRKNTANINLITHLEYDRASNLVTGKTAMKVMDAKKQAEKEILKAFYIDTTILKSSEYAEDLNILTKSSTANGALLAISVMLQGDRNIAELTPILASFSVDLGMDGSWDNEEVRAEIADWTMKKDMSKNGFASIKKNIENWKIENTVVPEFEGYAHNFWVTELGFAECSDKNVGTIAAVHNKYSSFYAAKDSAYTEGDSSLTRFICVANGDAYAWREATDKEKDIAALAPAAAGAVESGKINKSFVYVYDNGQWRRGTDLDGKLKFSCIKDSVGKTDTLIIDQDTSWYRCDNKQVVMDDETILTSWRTASAIESDTAGFGIPTGEAPLARIGNVSKSHYYVYENDAWRYGTLLDVDSGLGPCVKDSLNKVRKLSNVEGANAWYKCVDDGSEYVEGNRIPTVWRHATNFEMDTHSLEDMAIGSYSEGNVNPKLFYVKESYGWRPATTQEQIGLGACTAIQIDSVKQSEAKSNDSWYKCTNDYNTVIDTFKVPFTWRIATDIEKDTMGMKHGVGVSIEDSVIKGKINTDIFYVYENGAYRVGLPLDSVLNANGAGPCTEEKASFQNNSSTGILVSVKIDGKENKFKCTSVDTLVKGTSVKTAWRLATSVEIDTYGWKTAYFGTCKRGSISGKYYVYDRNVKWRATKNLECTMQLTGCDSIGEFQTASNKTKYICDEEGWRELSEFEKDTDSLKIWCAGTGSKGIYYKPTSFWTDTAIYMYHIQKGRVNTNNKYVCDNKVIREATPIEVKLGEGCTNYNEGPKTTTSTDYECKNSEWEVVKGSVYYDGKYYKTVRINKNTWMAENLNYMYSGDGLNDQNIRERSDYVVYNWYVAMKCVNSTCPTSTTAEIQGVCPTGWHIPTYQDANDLISTVGKNNPDDLLDISLGETDLYGFSSLLKDRYYQSSSNSWFGEAEYLWLSNRKSLRIIPNGSSVGSPIIDIGEGAVMQSVRCVKNK